MISLRPPNGIRLLRPINSPMMSARSAMSHFPELATNAEEKGGYDDERCDEYFHRIAGDVTASEAA
jgi:hypothetical protein